MLALNSLLFVKILTNKFIGKKWLNTFEEVINEGLERKHDYEVTNIQKKNCIGSCNISSES